MNKDDIIELIAYGIAVISVLAYLLYILGNHLTYDAIAKSKARRRKEFFKSKSK
jgi:hypothetical protein